MPKSIHRTTRHCQTIVFEMTHESYLFSFPVDRIRTGVCFTGGQEGRLSELFLAVLCVTLSSSHTYRPSQAPGPNAPQTNLVSSGTLNLYSVSHPHLQVFVGIDFF